MKIENHIILFVVFLKTSLLFSQYTSYTNVNQSDSINQEIFFTSYENYTNKNGLLSNKITGIAQDKLGYLWFSSNKGLTRFDGNDFKNFTRNDGLEANYVNCIKTDNDSLLIGSQNALIIRKNNKFYSLESKRINCFSKIKGTIFIGSNEGIFRLGEDFLAPLRTNFQIDLKTINDIAFDGEKYWVATENALWKIDNILNPNTIEKVDTAYFTSILIQKDFVIATTLNQGIKIIHNNNISTINLTTSNIKGIRKIQNQFWVFSSNDGIEILNSNFSFNRKINKYNIFKTNAISDVFEDKQHNIWVATFSNGIFKFNSPKNIQSPPSVSFENIEVLYESLDTINLNNYKGILKLPSNKNHLAFSYKSVDINNPKNILYRYKLNGDYSPWSDKNSVNLANLQAGEYTFSVQSKIADEKESNPIQFQFFIDKPIYQKSWFQWMSAGIILLLTGLFTYSYIKRIRVKNEAKIQQLQLENHLLMLEQKALQLQMNPHFIFNVLNGIKALGNAGKTAELNSTITKFSSLLRAILNTSRKDDVSLSEEISTLTNYISLEQQMSTNPFTFSITTKLSLDTEEILIPPMLIQPFVENSIKHGIKSKNNGVITIHFSEFNNFLHCEIIDNGIGIHQSKKEKKVNDHASLALKVTKERINNLTTDPSLKFTELKDNGVVTGTKVWFKIPLKTDF